MLETTCKITNYRSPKEGETVMNIPPVVISSCGSGDYDMAVVNIEGIIAKVSIDEMIAALKSCEQNQLRK